MENSRKKRKTMGSIISKKKIQINCTMVKYAGKMKGSMIQNEYNQNLYPTLITNREKDRTKRTKITKDQHGKANKMVFPRTIDRSTTHFKTAARYFLPNFYSKFQNRTTNKVGSYTGDHIARRSQTQEHKNT